MHGPGTPHQQCHPRYPALPSIKWGSRPTAQGGVRAHCHVWGAPTVGRCAPTTPHCRLRPRLLLLTACSAGRLCPHTPSARLLKVPQIENSREASMKPLSSLILTPCVPLRHVPPFRTHGTPRPWATLGGRGAGQGGGRQHPLPAQSADPWETRVSKPVRGHSDTSSEAPTRRPPHCFWALQRPSHTALSARPLLVPSPLPYSFLQDTPGPSRLSQVLPRMAWPLHCPCSTAPL